MARRTAPEINAGSMADIAFLLLIFFLVATTMEVDGGIPRKLPQKQPLNAPPPPVIKAKNVLEISINRNDQLLVEGDQRVELKDIKNIALEFIDNGSGDPTAKPPLAPCSYCKGGPDGVIDQNSSVHPEKAVISLKVDRGTSYGASTAVQDALSQAYNDLRNQVSKSKYGVSYDALLARKKIDKGNEKLLAKIKTIKGMYPEIISEVEPK